MTFQELRPRLQLAGAGDDFLGAPSANDDSYVAYHDQVLAILAPGLLSNDTDPSNQTLQAIAVTPPAHGFASVSPDGSLNYTPTSGYLGEDQLLYRVIDSDGNESGVATVTIQVGPGIIISDGSMDEGGAIAFTVSLTTAPLAGQQVTVAYATEDGTARTDISCDDYISGGGTLTFLAGQISHTVTVQTIHDSTPEDDEMFQVKLSQPTGAYVVDGSGTGSIVNNDAEVVVPRQRMVTATESGVGGLATVVKVYDGLTETLAFPPITPYPGFSGSVRVATDDFNLDGTPDIVTVPGPGGSPNVRIFDGTTGHQFAGILGSFFAYGAEFTYGLFVATADINGDGRPDIITGTDSGAASNLLVFSGLDTGLIWNTSPYGGFAGGVRVAAGDTNGDGRADIITGAGAGGGPLVLVFNGTNQVTLAGIYPYAPSFPGGVYVAGGDLNADGRTDIISGAGATGGPHVRAFSGPNQTDLANFFAYAPTFTGGVRVGAGDVLGIGKDSILTIPGVDGGAHAKAFDANGTDMCGYFVDAPTRGSFITSRQFPQIILEIYDGQFGQKNRAASQRGAYTVANLNDTDGDGRVDNSDPDVRSHFAVAGNTVKDATYITVGAADFQNFNDGDNVWIYSGSDTKGPADRRTITSRDGFNLRLNLNSPLSIDFGNGRVTHGGRDDVDGMKVGDVDLMRLRIRYPSTVPVTKPVTLTVVSGQVRLWTNDWKGTEIALTGNQHTFNPVEIGAGRTIYVEATDVSDSLRDIKLVATHNGTSTAVIGTALWVESIGFKHDQETAQHLTEVDWKDIAGPAKARVDFYGGVGLRPADDRIGIVNSMAMQFTILPARPAGTGTWEGDGVAFDVARTGTHLLWGQDTPGANWREVTRQESQFVMYRPPQIERANDDISPDDESVQATNLGNFYSTDAPGRTSRRALSAYGVAAKANFEEWLRVRFDGVRPEGNTVAGSRMSPFKLWHYANTVKRQGTLFYRNPPGNADNLTEGPSNNIGPDHEIPLVPPQVT